jgi:hypothetical protein
MTGMATGHYDVRLLDRRLTSVAYAQTWFADQDVTNEEGAFPETDHQMGAVGVPSLLYQPPGPTHLVVAGTQPPSILNKDVVDDYVARIEAGYRPAALVAAHAASRQAYNSTVPVHSLTGFVLDGHHKLAAYDALDLPARVVWICDLTPRLSSGYEPVSELFDEILGSATGQGRCSSISSSTGVPTGSEESRHLSNFGH